jgi:hypothetical protein
MSESIWLQLFFLGLFVVSALGAWSFSKVVTSLFRPHSPGSPTCVGERLQDSLEREEMAQQVRKATKATKEIPAPQERLPEIYPWPWTN